MFRPDGASLVLEALTGARFSEDAHARAREVSASAAAHRELVPAPAPAPAHVADPAAVWGVTFTASGGGTPCAICLDAMDAGQRCRALPCIHSFHDACLARWPRRSCPTCRYCE